jgi:2-polyprenyl-3-methyl-5-hydroxy-6-metoxy-1,4-benzoquinol methylase
MQDSCDSNKLESSECPQCILCGSSGNLIHTKLTDRLFHVPGEWNFRKCRNENCALVWIDPMPHEAEIYKAYINYYTHQEREKKTPSGFRRSISEKLLNSYKRFLRVCLGEKSPRENHYLMYLRDKKPGRLLEIGCGSGKRLSRLKSLGWQVEGQEVDQKAASVAQRKYGFPVHLGDLTDLKLGVDTYDAIVMNHVIEHVHHPVELLSESRRLLKPGGSLIAITPNADSQEHHLFMESWFSLDPPRHLHIFTPRALENLAALLDFSKHEVWTTSVNSDYVVASSLKIKSLGDMKANEDKLSKLKRGIAGVYFQLWAKHSRPHMPNQGEECVLRAFK